MVGLSTYHAVKFAQVDPLKKVHCFDKTLCLGCNRSSQYVNYSYHFQKIDKNSTSTERKFGRDASAHFRSVSNSGSSAGAERHAEGAEFAFLSALIAAAGDVRYLSANYLQFSRCGG